MTTTPTRPKHRPHQRGINAAMQRQRRMRTIWIAGGIAAIVAVAAILAIVFGGGKDDSVPQTRPVTITGTALPAFTGLEGDTAIGMAAPQLAGTSFDASAVSITPGQPTMVVFVAHWCPHCQVEIPRLVEWYGQGHAPTGLRVVAVSTAVDKPSGNYPPSEWLETEKWPWSILVDNSDSAAVTSFGFSGYPAFALIDAAGTVQYRVTGEVEIPALDALLLEKLGLE